MRIKYNFLLLLVASFLLPTAAFAGGSSAELEVQGKAAFVRPAGFVKDALKLNIQTYYAEASGLFPVNVEDLSLNNISVSCTGGNLISSFSLREGATLIGKQVFKKGAPFHLPEGETLVGNDAPLFTANFAPKNLIIHNHTERNLSIDLQTRYAKKSQTVHCGISNITLFDMNNHQVIYSDADTNGTVYVGSNEAAMITLPAQTPMVVLNSTGSYGTEYIGSGYIKAKILRIGDSDLSEDTTKYVMQVYSFDSNFNALSEIKGVPRPVNMYLKISDADAAKLPENTMITLKVRDPYMVAWYASGNGGYPVGTMIYVKQ